MRRKWIPIGLVVGLLAAAITGGAVLASGGDPGGDNGKAATEVLAEGPDGMEAKIAEILGTDPQATADAFAQVASEIDAEYVDAVLQKAVEGGHITTERADAIRSQVQSGDYSGLDQLWQDSYEKECGGEPWFSEPQAYQEYPNRVGAILNVDGQKVADAMDRASEEWYAEEAGAPSSENGYDSAGESDPWTARVAEILGTDPQATADAMAQVEAEIEAEYVDAILRAAAASGHITAEQADAIRAQVQSGDYSGLDQLWMDNYEECTVDFWDVEREVVSHEEYYDRIGAILDVDGQRVADAIEQAYGELYPLDPETWDNESGPVEQEPVEPATAGAANG